MVTQSQYRFAVASGKSRNHFTMQYLKTYLSLPRIGTDRYYLLAFPISLSKPNRGPASKPIPFELHFSRFTNRRLTSMNMKIKLLLCFLFLCLITAQPALADSSVPTPKDVLGFQPGEDRKLASWEKVVEYFQRLDEASDRVSFQTIGKTTMEKPFVVATISAPENLARLNEYKDIQAKLADPRKLGPLPGRNEAAKKLIARGKTVVLITCGIHSTEVGSYLSSMLIAYRLASSDEPEIKSILQNTIILLVPSLNPDGVDIVKNWYDKTLGTPYEGTESSGALP